MSDLFSARLLNRLCPPVPRVHRRRALFFLANGVRSVLNCVVEIHLLLGVLFGVHHQIVGLYDLGVHGELLLVVCHVHLGLVEPVLLCPLILLRTITLPLATRHFYRPPSVILAIVDVLRTAMVRYAHFCGSDAGAGRSYGVLLLPDHLSFWILGWRVLCCSSVSLSNCHIHPIRLVFIAVLRQLRLVPDMVRVAAGGEVVEGLVHLLFDFSIYSRARRRHLPGDGPYCLGDDLFCLGGVRYRLHLWPIVNNILHFNR